MQSARAPDGRTRRDEAVADSIGIVDHQLDGRKRRLDTIERGGIALDELDAMEPDQRPRSQAAGMGFGERHATETGQIGRRSVDALDAQRDAAPPRASLSGYSRYEVIFSSASRMLYETLV